MKEARRTARFVFPTFHSAGWHSGNRQRTLAVLSCGHRPRAEPPMEPASSRSIAAVPRAQDDPDAVAEPPASPARIATPLDEYKHLGEDLRHYGILRLYRLTLLLGTTGALITALASDAVRSNALLVDILKVGGLAVTLAFAIMDYRSGQRWMRMQRRANALAESLGFERRTLGNEWNPLTTTGVSRVLHAFVVGAWLFVIALSALRAP
jgi:hypothetical protein